MSIVTIYNNEVNQVDALEEDAHFLDFEDDNDDIWLLCINIYFYSYNIYTIKCHSHPPY